MHPDGSRRTEGGERSARLDLPRRDYRSAARLFLWRTPTDSLADVSDTEYRISIALDVPHEEDDEDFEQRTGR